MSMSSVDGKGCNRVSGRGRLTRQHGTCSSQFIRSARENKKCRWLRLAEAIIG